MRRSVEEQQEAHLGQLLLDAFRGCAEKYDGAREVAEEQENRTLKPTVIIGLGGAGCGVGAQLKKRLQRYYRNMPDQLGMVRFVMLDTEQLSGHSVPEVQTAFSEAGEYVFLGGFNPKSWLETNLNDDAALRRWWPRDARVAGTTITAGCRRLRHLGRLCLYYHRVAVELALSNAVTQALALNEQAVNDGVLPPLGDGQLSVHVISGSCGGTGSGMLLDLLTLVRRVLRNQGQVGAHWSAIVLMPTFYRQAGANVSPLLLKARSANGYAFLRELQHFYHHPETWPQFMMDAEELQQAAADIHADADVPAMACYLMDNEVNGRVLTNIQDIFQITADALFQKLTRPVVDARTIDADAMLLTENRDRIRAFSSMGLSYIIYPKQTIARCAGASVLRDIVDHRLRRSLTEDEREKAKKRAEALFKEQARLFDPIAVQNSLQRSADALKQQVPTVPVIQSMAKTQPKPARKNAMDTALARTKAAAAQAKDRVRSVAAGMMAAAQAEIENCLLRQVRELGGSDTLSFVQEVLTELKRMVEGQQLHVPSGTGQPDTSSERATNTGKLIDQVRQLEMDWWPDAWQGKRFQPLIDEFAKALVGVFDAEVTAEAASQSRAYRDQVVVPALEKAVKRCQAALGTLETLRNQLDFIAKQTDPVADEHNVSITTQYAPLGGVEEAIKQTIKQVQNDDGLWSAILGRLAESEYLWRLGDPDPDARFEVAKDLCQKMPGWICSRPEIDAVLKRSLGDAIKAEIGGEEFANGPMTTALQLADPTWRVNRDMMGGNLQANHFLVAGLPHNFPPEWLPPDIRAVAGSAVTLPSNRIMILKIEHALPLHALGGVQDLGEHYRMWTRSAAGRTEPAHPENAWAEDPERHLEDIYPRAKEALAESFALGIFTHWLVSDRKLPQAQSIIHGWTRGVVYERTPNQFYVVQLEKKRGRITVADERQLNQDGGRAAAMERFTQQDEANVHLFMTKLAGAVGADEVRKLIEEYCDTVLRPKIGPDARVAEGLKKQLRKELETLEKLL